MINVERALQIEGWMSEQELIWLADNASKHRIILEIGCFIGRTTRALADNTSGGVFALDLWKAMWIEEELKLHDPEAFEITKKYPDFFQNFKFNLQDRIKEFKVFPILDMPNILFDMIFIDADHSYEGVSNDIQRAIRHLTPNGLLCGHDFGNYKWPDVARAVHDSLGAVKNPVGSIWVRKS